MVKKSALILLAFFLSGCLFFSTDSRTTPGSDTTIETPSSVTTTAASITPESEAIPAQPVALSPITANNAARLVVTASLPVKNASLIAWLPETDEVVIRTPDRVLLYDVASQMFTREINLPEDGSLLSFNPARRLFAITTDRLSISIRDLDNKEVLNLSPEGGFGSAGFEPDGSMIWLTSMEEFRADAYDVSTGEKIRECGGFETAAPVYSAFPSNGGKWLVWIARATLQTNRLSDCAVSTRIGHEDFISSMAFNPDETVVATSAGGTIENEFMPFIFLWDPTDGSLIRQIQIQETPAISLAFSPDGTILASAGSGLSIWNATTGEKVATLAPVEKRYTSILFSEDGALLTAATESDIQVYKIKP